MMKLILSGLAAILLLLVVVGFVLPTEYEIEESVAIQATPAQVHAHLEDLEKWPAWAPWVEADPTIVTTYGTTTVGVGASQTWTSESGDGELELTQCDPATGIAYDMAFISGDTRAPAAAAMSYSASGDTTTVTWTMSGDMGEFMPPVVAGLMTPIMKSSIGSMFAQGLDKLKLVVESDS